MALERRTTTNHELDNYDNPNKGLSGHGYDVPKRPHVGYAAPVNQTNRRNTGNGGEFFTVEMFPLAGRETCLCTCTDLNERARLAQWPEHTPSISVRSQT